MYQVHARAQLTGEYACKWAISSYTDLIFPRLLYDIAECFDEDLTGRDTAST